MFQSGPVEYQPEPSTIQFSEFSSLTRLSRSTRTTYKSDQVRSMFNRIAPRYDLLNHVLSSGIDVLWRKRAIRLLRSLAPRDILDVATGTGDFAFEAAASLHPRRVVGVDVADEMLRIAEMKAAKKGLDGLVSFEEGSAERLPFKSSSFDAVISAFGVRNFSDLNQGLKEFARILKPGGSAVILEFSRPRVFPVKQLYSFYSKTVLPSVGGFLSGDREAYQYLPGTIREFPDGNEFLSMIEAAGFQSLQHHRLTFGIATIYHGRKKDIPGKTRAS